MDFQILNKMDATDMLAELNNSAEYRGFLQVMSHFSRYSWRNIFLIYKQMPNATKLDDYKGWKECGRTIRQGITGIRISIPVEQPPKRKFVEKIDPATGTVVLDENSKRVMEELLVEQPVQFKPASYMDISQTEGAPVLFLAGDVISDEALRGVFTDVLKTMSMPNEQFDFYGAIKQISLERLENADTNKADFIIDSISFVVCQRFGVESDIAFNALDRLLDWETVEIIGKNSDRLITAIEDRFAVVCKERGLSPMTLPRAAEIKPETQPQSPKYIKELRTETVEGIEFSQYAVKPVSESGIIEERITETAAPKPAPGKQAKPSEKFEPPTLKYLPDTSISIAERNEYGYIRPELLPLTKDRAISLFRRDMTVYLLYKDNTEIMAHYLSNIENHDGIFGIAYGAWLNSREYIALASGNPEARREAEFIYDGGDSFAVYQTEPGGSPAAYKSYEELQAKGFDINRHKYNLVYTAPLPASPSDTPAGLFMWVNAERLDGYNGRALAISDVLSIKKDEIITSYYANGRTFKELLSFIGEERRRNAREVEVIVVEKEITVIPLAEETPQPQQQVELLITAPETEATGTTSASKPATVQSGPPETPPPALPVIKSEQAVYRLSAQKAEEHGVMEVYELSRRMDIECAKAIDETIKAHKKGDNRYELITPAEILLKEYGAERMTWVLSKQVLSAPKRFSEANCSWASEFINDETGSGDKIPAFTITTHHAVLDAFTNQFRAVLAKKPAFNERMKDAKRKSEAHNNSSG